MPYAQLLVKHGPLNQENGLSNELLKRSFYDGLQTLNTKPTELTKLLFQWASINFDQQALSAATSEPIKRERLLFQQKIAYEIVQLLILLNANSADETVFEKNQTKAINIYLTYRLYSSFELKDDSVEFKKIIDLLLTRLHLSSDALDQGHPPQNSLLTAFGQIADKLTKQRTGTQGGSDIQYALHFASLILVLKTNSNEQLEKWKASAPYSWSSKYATTLLQMNTVNLRSTPVQMITLMQIYSIVKNLILEHPDRAYSAAHAHVIAYGKEYLPGARITSVEDFFNETEKRIFGEKYNSASSSTLLTSNYSNNNAHVGYLPPEAIHLMPNPALAAQNVATVAETGNTIGTEAARAVGEVVNAGGAELGDVLGGCALSIM